MNGVSFAASPFITTDCCGGGDGGALKRPSERWVEVWEAANIANTTVHCITDLAVKLISSEE